MDIHILALALLKIAGGIALSSLLGRSTGHAMRAASLRYSRFTHRVLATVIFFLFLFWALTDVGIDPKVLFNSAGVVTLTVGLIARTTVSNFVSGLFLLVERPFAVGDRISVGVLERPFEVSGEAIAVDFISTKLLTEDNVIVRLPNSTVMGARITNYTRRDRRRASVPFSVKPGTDLQRLHRRLRKYIERRNDFLDETSVELATSLIGPDHLECRVLFWCEPSLCEENENAVKHELLRLLGKTQNTR